eukprot:Opistho-2@39553
MMAIPDEATWIADASARCGGVSSIIRDIVRRMRVLFVHSHSFDSNKLSRPCGIFITGPSGVGKTTIATSVASASTLPTFLVNGADVFKRDEGDSEAVISLVFKRARACAPSIIIIDGVESVAPSSDDAGAAERRLASHLCAEVDTITHASLSSSASSNQHCGPVCVIAIAANASLVAARARSTGRLDYVVAMGMPTASQRLEILSLLSKPLCGLPLCPNDETLAMVADHMHGYTPADIRSVFGTAVTRAASRQSTGGAVGVDDPSTGSSHTLSPLSWADFATLLEQGVPSALLGQTAPKGCLRVRLDDIAGVEDIMSDLRLSVVFPLKHPRAASKLGVRAPRGVLLHGPPGTGKTAIAMALAAETGLGICVLNGSEARSKVVGESERTLSRFMAQARLASPCVVIMDDVDAIAPRRNTLETAGEQAGDRLLSSLLTEMDGLWESAGSGAGSNPSIVFVATTSRFDSLDPAVLRPGRLEKHVSVPMPDENARVRIFERFLSKMPATDTVLETIPAVARDTPGYTGADIAAVCNEAGMCAIRAGSATVELDHVNASLGTIIAQSAEVDSDGDSSGTDDAVESSSSSLRALSRELRRLRMQSVGKNRWSDDRKKQQQQQQQQSRRRSAGAGSRGHLPVPVAVDADGGGLLASGGFAVAASETPADARSTSGFNFVYVPSSDLSFPCG